MALSTAHVRLDQTAVILGWLLAKHPGKESLNSALESVRTALIVIRNTSL